VDSETGVQVREAEVREDDVLPAPADDALPATKGNNDVPRFSIKTRDIL
jgi:hypothetical protein